MKENDRLTVPLVYIVHSVTRGRLEKPALKREHRVGYPIWTGIWNNVLHLDTLQLNQRFRSRKASFKVYKTRIF